MISDGNELIEVKVIYIYIFVQIYYLSSNVILIIILNMKVLIFRDFVKKYKLENDTMNEFQLQKSYNYPIYPRDSKIYSDRRFVNIDNGSQGGTHWCAFYVKDNKFYYFDSFVGALDKVLLNQLPKPISYHNYKIQYINSKLCGSHCLYFFYLIERMKYYDVVLKLYFG